MTTVSRFAEQAWLPDGFVEGVRIQIGADGALTSAAAGEASAATRLGGYVLPGMPNLHSHAFQRAMAGLAERQSNPDDSFWTWREVMYAFAGCIGPDELRAIAAQLYVEMLKAGYTQVCEFHYLHHQPDGTPYADPAAMSLALIEAARETGIGLTLLPTLYMTGGFDGRPLSERQRRFRHDVDGYLRLLERLQKEESARVRVGIALHSLRAVPEAAMRSVLESGLARDCPIHIHVAEQIGEVQDCLAIRNARPVEWLLDHAPVDCALVPRACDAPQRRRDASPRRERRRGGTLPDDRGESRRRPVSAQVLSRCRRTHRHRFRQPHLGVGRRGTALARIRPAARDAPTQCERVARIAEYRRNAVSPRARRRRAGSRRNRRRDRSQARARISSCSTMPRRCSRAAMRRTCSTRSCSPATRIW